MGVVEMSSHLQYSLVMRLHFSSRPECLVVDVGLA